MDRKELIRQLEVLAEHLRRQGEVHDAALIKEAIKTLKADDWSEDNTPNRDVMT